MNTTVIIKKGKLQDPKKQPQQSITCKVMHYFKFSSLKIGHLILFQSFLPNLDTNVIFL